MLEKFDISNHEYSVCKQIRITVEQQWTSCQNSCLDKLHPSDFDENLRIVLPRKFRELRALSIAVWYLPETLKWNILMRLQEVYPNLDFENKGLDHSVTLKLLSSSQRNMENYVLFIINPRELFGTILREDLQSALRNLRIFRTKPPRILRKIRRKGYQDKGTWRPIHCWLEKFDISYTELQNERENKLKTITTTTQQLTCTLERLRS